MGNLLTPVNTDDLWGLNKYYENGGTIVSSRFESVDLAIDKHYKEHPEDKMGIRISELHIQPKTWIWCYRTDKKDICAYDVNHVLSHYNAIINVLLASGTNTDKDEAKHYQHKVNAIKVALYEKRFIERDWNKPRT